MLHRSIPVAVACVLGLGAVAVSVALSVPALSAAQARSSGLEVSFSEEILPIFERSCTSCHGGVDEDGNKRLEEELDLTSYEGVMAGSSFGTIVEPGDADGSVLMDMITTGDMPSQDDGPMDPLTPEEIELIRAWINEGAPNS